MGGGDEAPVGPVAGDAGGSCSGAGVRGGQGLAAGSCLEKGRKVQGGRRGPEGERRVGIGDSAT